jgi:ribonucleoside-diphosphate reductase alpha chain
MSDEVYGPRTEFAAQLHADKYRTPGESFEDGMRRVARAVSREERDRSEIEELLLDQRGLPAGRIQAAMGIQDKDVTPYNCFVSGPIPDSFVSRDNAEQSSIMHRAEQAAATMRKGGGIGYDFSTLRPRGALIRKLQSKSSGPISFMKIFNEVCKATSSAGNRRGAQMGVLRIDHPDAPEFIRMKNNHDFLTGFNTSLFVTDAFMEALEADGIHRFVFDGTVYGDVRARDLWSDMMASTHQWAEPGVLFGDTINRMNNLWYCEKITATNPCGEQPLGPHAACLLWSQNLVKYVIPNGRGGWAFDYEWLASDVPLVVRALDHIIDVANYPLPEQREQALLKRRMGIGVTGLANALEAMGHPYGSMGFIETEARILHLINREAYLEGVRLARRYGSFPLFDREKFCRGEFFKTLDSDVQDLIRRYGLRNSHYTSIAPTGTISMSADNVSSSVEPVYRYQQNRDVIMPEGKINVDLYDYGFSNFRVRGRRTSMGEVTAQQHISVLTTAQAHVDSAVSKTVNMDASMPMEDFERLYIDAYLGGAKGCTTFNKDGRRAGLFVETPEASDLPFPDESASHRQSYTPPEVREMVMIPSSESAMELVADQAAYGDGSSCTFDPSTGRRSCE